MCSMQGEICNVDGTCVDTAEGHHLHCQIMQHFCMHFTNDTRKLGECDCHLIAKDLP